MRKARNLSSNAGGSIHPIGERGDRSQFFLFVSFRVFRGRSIPAFRVSRVGRTTSGFEFDNAAKSCLPGRRGMLDSIVERQVKGIAALP